MKRIPYVGCISLICLFAQASLSTAAANSLYIGGTPATTVAVGNTYAFRPWLSVAPAKSAVKFIIYNQPGWSIFNTSTGELYGRVGASQVGTYPDIVIAAISDGKAAHVPPFSITVKPAAAASVPPAGSAVPVITGAPASSATVGSAYSFEPAAQDPSHATLTFSVANAPSWASFDRATGRLSGIPAAANVGTTSNILIRASDGHASAALAPFSITVSEPANGSVTLSWTAPTTNTNGTPLNDLAGYRILYGANPGALTQVIAVSNPGLTDYVIDNLAPQTYYFNIVAYTASGLQSSLSNLVSATVK